LFAAKLALISWNEFHELPWRARDIALRAGGCRWLLWLTAIRLSRREWQTRGIAQNLLLLGRELIEAAGFNRPLPGIRGHGPQTLNGISHRALPVRRQIAEL
jgi:hypothetical protein